MEEVVFTTQEEATQSLSQPMPNMEGMVNSTLPPHMGSFFSSSFGSFNPQYLHQSIPPFTSSTQPFLTQPFMQHPIATQPFSMYANPSSLSFPQSQPSFSQSLSLPSLSENQKLTPTNYSTWNLFMQLLLESAGVWQLIANPLLVDPAYRSMMDSRAKALMVHGMSPSIVSQFLSQGISAQQLWISIRDEYGKVSSVKIARLEEELDKLSFSDSDNLLEKLGEFKRIKRQLEEFGTVISNPVHKLLGKLPSSFESFKDTIYLRVPFPSFEETLGLLHDKCLSRKPPPKHDAAFLGQS